MLQGRSLRPLRVGRPASVYDVGSSGACRSTMPPSECPRLCGPDRRPPQIRGRASQVCTGFHLAVSDAASLGLRVDVISPIQSRAQDFGALGVGRDIKRRVLLLCQRFRIAAASQVKVLQALLAVTAMHDDPNPQAACMGACCPLPPKALPRLVDAPNTAGGLPSRGVSEQRPFHSCRVGGGD